MLIEPAALVNKWVLKFEAADATDDIGITEHGIYVPTLTRNVTDQLSVLGILPDILDICMLLRRALQGSNTARVPRSLSTPDTVSNLNSSAKATSTAHASAVQVGNPRRVALH